MDKQLPGPIEKPPGILSRRNLKMDKLSPSISGHPVELNDPDVPPELDRLSPSLERPTRFRHFDHMRGQSPSSDGKIKSSKPSPLATDKQFVPRNESCRISSSSSTRGCRGSTRTRRSYSDPDPVQYVPDIEVDDVDDGAGHNDNVFNFETQEDRSFLFKAASYVLHGAKGLNRKNLRLRNSEPGYSANSASHKPKMFLAKKSKKLVIRMPDGELVEGEFNISNLGTRLFVENTFSEQHFVQRYLLENNYCSQHVKILAF